MKNKRSRKAMSDIDAVGIAVSGLALFLILAIIPS